MGPTHEQHCVVILVVEDSDIDRYVTSTILTRAGAEVIGARCAEDGLMLVENDLLAKVSAIVLDIKLPGMNGVEMAKMLRTDPRFVQTPIILVTGWYPLFPALAGDADAVLLKPMPEGVLEQTVMSLARQGRRAVPQVAQSLAVKTA